MFWTAKRMTFGRGMMVGRDMLLSVEYEVEMLPKIIDFRNLQDGAYITFHTVCGKFSNFFLCFIRYFVIEKKENRKEYH